MPTTGVLIFFLITFYLFVCLACHGACVEVRGWLEGVVSFLPPCRSQGPKSDHQAWQQGHLTALSVRILIGISSPCFESVCFSTSLPQSTPLIEAGMNQLPAGPSAFSLEPPQSLIHLALAVLVSKHVSDHFPYFKGVSLFLSKYLMTISAQVPDSSEQVSILKSVFTPPTTMPSTTALAANSWGSPEWGWTPMVAAVGV